TWRKITAGLPKGDMGKIGLAVTPADPNLVYATIEAKEKEKGFYRSTDKGESWEKRNDYISGGTGPHYYQRLFASPTNPDLVYQMDVFVHVTRDGGKTITRLEDGHGKHSDNHAFWIDPANGDHLLIGCDAGLYETFDEAKTFRHFPNLPISQFYRTAVDNSTPFYNILGGAQDLGTLFGPSRTMHTEGVRNQDWYVPLGADGYHVAFDPVEPHIFYIEFQVGNLFRYDRRSEEIISIKPQPEPGEPPERWNWDAPIIISPHNPHRLYFGSQRVWRSDDRGHSWTAVSGDLTRNENRYELATMGRVWSVDDLHDTGAMSKYNTISNLAESPLVEGLLYVGTDDGLIQVSEDGGQNWHTAVSLPEVPGRAFIQSVRASQHDPDTVFAIADAHKIGDFAPYIFESNDRGHTWRSLRGDLPDGMILWALEQDHEAANLLFLAAEYGLYVSLNGGENWHKLRGNVPTIAFRDLKLQRRDNDLVGASFGRGFYVLDDYTPLREMARGALATLETDAPAHLFPVRDAWWYVPYQPMQSKGQPTLGTTAFKGPNPDFGALFTYYLPADLLSGKKARHKAEKELREQNADTPFPGWEQLRQEATEAEPQVLLLVRNEAGEPLRWLAGGATEAGLHRLSWDLRLSPPDPVRLKKPDFMFPWESDPQGALVPPGAYSVQLYVSTAVSNYRPEPVGDPQSFTLTAVPTAPAETDFTVTTRFQQEANDLLRRVQGAEKEIERAQVRLNHCRAALVQTPLAEADLFERTAVLRTTLAQLETELSGDKVRGQLNEATVPPIRERIGRLVWGHGNTRQPPTATQERTLALASQDFEALLARLRTFLERDLATLEADLASAGAPWTPGRRLA
ncbi:MAG: hypothetical protein KDD89_06905, partial [Anaerolineales bacterium]|nr:hypothetical protein [Anaerolineales bacterium]